MTRDETEALYRPIRAAVRRHLGAAPEGLSREQIGACAERIDFAEDASAGADAAWDMLIDAALFTPDERDGGRRPIERYAAGLIDREERAFARRLAKGVFSVWRVRGRHAVAGLVVDDALGMRKRKQLVDLALERAVADDDLVAMRLFDAGPFWAGFGICLPVSGWAVTLLRGGFRGFPHLLELVYSSAMRGEPVEATILESLSLPDGAG